MNLSKEELIHIWGDLKAKRMYKDSPLPSFIKVWQPYMEDFLIKIEKEIEEKYPGTRLWHDHNPKENIKFLDSGEKTC